MNVASTMGKFFLPEDSPIMQRDDLHSNILRKGKKRLQFSIVLVIYELTKVNINYNDTS